MITGSAEKIAWSGPVFKHNCLFLVSMFDRAGQSFLLLPPLRMTTGSAFGDPERISGPFCLFDLCLMILV